MSLVRITTAIRDFAKGETYDLDSAGGRIFINQEGFGYWVAVCLGGSEATKAPRIAKELEAINILNEKIRSHEMEDPEPFEDELLELCTRFLENFEESARESG